MHALAPERRGTQAWLMTAGAVATLGGLWCLALIPGAPPRVSLPTPPPAQVRLLPKPMRPMPELPVSTRLEAEPTPQKAVAGRLPISRQRSPEPPAARPSHADSPDTHRETVQPSEAEDARAPLQLGLTLKSTTSTRGAARFAAQINGTSSETGTAFAVSRTGAPGPVGNGDPRAGVGPGRHLTKQPTDATLRRGASPAYPASARRAGIEGVVVLAVTIDESGYVQSAEVLRGLGYGLDESAIAAARATLWVPATLGGRAVATTRRFTVRFSLDG